MSVTWEQRVQLGNIMDYMVHNNTKIGYIQKRPMVTRNVSTFTQLKTIVDSGKLSMDCSESVTLNCHVVGLKDPNGLNYNGEGYTGTLLNHLPRYKNPANADIGALCVFGVGTGKHVAQVRIRGKNPTLYSHGSSRGPIYISLSEELYYQGSPVFTMLSILGL